MPSPSVGLLSIAAIGTSAVLARGGSGRQLRALGSSVLQTDDPDPEQFINGCIKKNGTIKVVDDPVECSAGETPISWLVTN